MIKDLCSGFPGKDNMIFYHLFSLTQCRNPTLEEFAIYMQYVRKLGFDETPDYDFLRDLFTKVLNNLGAIDDGVYDWMLLNDGKGWEVCTYMSF